MHSAALKARLEQLGRDQKDEPFCIVFQGGMQFMVKAVNRLETGDATDDDAEWTMEIIRAKDGHALNLYFTPASVSMLFESAGDGAAS